MRDYNSENVYERKKGKNLMCVKKKNCRYMAQKELLCLLIRLVLGKGDDTVKKKTGRTK